MKCLFLLYSDIYLIKFQQNICNLYLEKSTWLSFAMCQGSVNTTILEN